ncbi:MAG: MoxR family ATPase [Bacilli bacterium]|nr:MoxR family ATPase [Bacilli bacterium]
MNQSNITQEELNKCLEIMNKMNNYYAERIVGQQNLEKSLLISLMANGHILLESVPGLAKTTAAKVLTDSVSGNFSRIQCTPDLLPSDIVGTQVFNYQTSQFDTKLGPIYANFVLLDEINRSSAKTQSATLEAMQERQITIDGKIYLLPEIFIVIATQNPIEQEGTYILAEAQLDRFLMKEKIDYPTVKEEVEILKNIENKKLQDTQPVLTLEDLKYLQDITERVYLDESIKKYIAQIILATRVPENYIDKKLADYITLGSSPRGTIAFMQCSKALALMKGRTYVTPDDIKELRYCILRHRISLNFSAVADDVSVETIIDAILGAVPTP